MPLPTMDASGMFLPRSRVMLLLCEVRMGVPFVQHVHVHVSKCLPSGHLRRVQSARGKRA